MSGARSQSILLALAGLCGPGCGDQPTYFERVDIARPSMDDLAGPPADLTGQDLSLSDLSAPDMAVVDDLSVVDDMAVAMDDLAKLPDLAAPPDLTVRPDLTASPDLALTD